MIKTFVATTKGIEVRPLDMSKFSKVRTIMSMEDYPNPLEFPLPEVFGVACGNADVAICVDRHSGKDIPVVVPTGQRFVAESLTA